MTPPSGRLARRKSTTAGSSRHFPPCCRTAYPSLCFSTTFRTTFTQLNATMTAASATATPRAASLCSFRIRTANHAHPSMK